MSVKQILTEFVLGHMLIGFFLAKRRGLIGKAKSRLSLGSMNR